MLPASESPPAVNPRDELPQPLDPAGGRPFHLPDVSAPEMSTAVQLTTAAEYARLPDPGDPTELVPGEVVEMNQSRPRQGQVCGNTYFPWRASLKDQRAGHLATNDVGILTPRDPDTEHGADLCCVSDEKLPPGPLPGRTRDVPPDIVFEVLPPTDRQATILMSVSERRSSGRSSSGRSSSGRKVSESLDIDMGIPVACVVDPEAKAGRLDFPDRPATTLAEEKELTFPQQLPGFRVPVKWLFE